MTRSLLFAAILAMTACAKQAGPEASAAAVEIPVESPVMAREVSTPHQSVINRLPKDGTLVKVINTGDEPRRELRFSPEPGPAGTMRMVMEMGITMGVNDRAVPQVAIPPMVMDMAVEVQAIDEDGNIHFSAELVAVDVSEDADTPSDLTETLRADLERMVGMLSVGVVTATGETIESSTSMPEGTPDELSAHMDNMDKAISQLAQPMPDEAVGVGAKWETLSRVPAGGLDLAQQTMTEIIAWEGDRVTVRTTVLQTPIRLSMDVPEMPGVTATVSDFISKGSGESVIDLTSMTPVHAESDMDTDLTLEMSVGDMSQETHQHMTLSMTMEML